VKTYTNYMRGLDSYNYVTEVGFSGRSIRNVDPIQYMIRGILDGNMDLSIIDHQPDIIKKRIIRDISDITQGVLPMWMPRKFKLAKNKRIKLIKALKHYTK